MWMPGYKVNYSIDTAEENIEQGYFAIDFYGSKLYPNACSRLEHLHNIRTGQNLLVEFIKN